MTSAQPKPRAARRSSHQIRSLLLDSARALFEEQGYEATTTQQIVDRAQVDAPALYRHFASKAELFEATMLGTLKGFLDQYFAYSSLTAPGVRDPEELIRQFVAGFYDLMREHRESMRLLMAATPRSPLGNVAREVSTQFTEGLITLRKIIAKESDGQGYPGITNPDATAAAVTGMVLSLAIFDDWVFPTNGQPSRDAQINEITTVMLHGLAHRTT